MKKAVMLQVRLASRRLPDKALLNLSGEPVVAHCLHALRAVQASEYLLLTDRHSAAKLEPHARRYGFSVWVGSEHDVLDRYVSAVDAYNVDTVVRATGDNPLVSAWLANELLSRHEREEADYSGFLGMPLGAGVECIRADALRTAHAEARLRYDREHVAPYLYSHPERFRIHRPAVSDDLACETRVTLDTEDDFRFLSRIFDELWHGTPIEIHALVSRLRKPDLVRKTA
ncbi:MAG: cytidylyltransferase domain-containing protein [bacterium]